MLDKYTRTKWRCPSRATDAVEATCSVVRPWTGQIHKVWVAKANSRGNFGGNEAQKKKHPNWVDAEMIDISGVTTWDSGGNSSHQQPQHPGISPESCINHGTSSTFNKFNPIKIMIPSVSDLEAFSNLSILIDRPIDQFVQLLHNFRSPPT